MVPLCGSSFVRTSFLTGGPASACGLKVGRGAAAFREVVTDRPLGSVGSTLQG